MFAVFTWDFLQVGPRWEALFESLLIFKDESWESSKLNLPYSAYWMCFMWPWSCIWIASVSSYQSFVVLIGHSTKPSFTLRYLRIFSSKYWFDQRLAVSIWSSEPYAHPPTSLHANANCGWMVIEQVVNLLATPVRMSLRQRLFFDIFLHAYVLVICVLVSSSVIAELVDGGRGIINLFLVKFVTVDLAGSLSNQCRVLGRSWNSHLQRVWRGTERSSWLILFGCLLECLNLRIARLAVNCIQID